MPTTTRAAWLLTGLAWATSSLVQLADPQYWDPRTTLDYLAVYTFGLAWLLLSLAVALLARLLAERRIVVVAGIIAATAVTAGVANIVEDGLGHKAWGTVYIIGALATWIGLVPLALLVWRSDRPRLAIAPALNALAFATFPVGGGLLALIGWAAPALRPAAFGAAHPGERRG